MLRQLRTLLPLSALILSIVPPVVAAGAVVQGSTSPEGLSLVPALAYHRAVLIVAGDDGHVLRRQFAPGEPIGWELAGPDGLPLADGTYTWELWLTVREADLTTGEPEMVTSTGTLEVRDGRVVSSGPEPFSASAPTLTVDDDVIGLFTSAPDTAVELHVADGKPEIRLDNTSLSESWDLVVSLGKFQIVDTDATFDPVVLEIAGDMAGSYTLTFDGVLEHGSSRDSKRDLEPAHGAELLQALRELPLYAWTYNHDEANARHLGPMAEDFHAAFGLGRGARHISSADTAGLALAAIQALADKLDEKDQEIADLEARLAALETAAD